MKRISDPGSAFLQIQDKESWVALRRACDILSHPGALLFEKIRDYTSAHSQHCFVKLQQGTDLVPKLQEALLAACTWQGKRIAASAVLGRVP